MLLRFSIVTSTGIIWTYTLEVNAYNRLVNIIPIRVCVPSRHRYSATHYTVLLIVHISSIRIIQMVDIFPLMTPGQFCYLHSWQNILLFFVDVNITIKVSFLFEDFSHDRAQFWLQLLLLLRTDWRNNCALHERPRMTITIILVLYSQHSDYSIVSITWNSTASNYF